MSDSIKNKTTDGKDGGDTKDISFDFKLMFVYHITMMFLFMFNPIEEPLKQLEFAVTLSILLIIASVVHKLRTNWTWPGLSRSSIPSAIFTLIFTYSFLVFSSSTISNMDIISNIDLESLESLMVKSWRSILNAASNPTFTPWYLAGAGIGLMNILVALNLATHKKSAFKVQCKNG